MIALFAWLFLTGPFYQDARMRGPEGVLRRNCLGCHNDRREGGVMIFTRDGELSPNVSRSRISKAVKSGRMPKGGFFDLPAADVTALQKWARDGGDP
jgi:hypothetical protein